MEISEKEYLELKEQIKRLQAIVDGTEKPRSDLSGLVSELPISLIRNSCRDYPDFVYEKSTNAAAWKTFVQLAKIVHEDTWKFVMDKAYDKKPFIRSVGKLEIPRRISCLSNEQIAVSVQMLNEMIPIFNKYFKQTHESVLYSDSNDGQYRRIYVEKELTGSENKKGEV